MSVDTVHSSLVDSANSADSILVESVNSDDRNEMKVAFIE